MGALIGGRRGLYRRRRPQIGLAILAVLVIATTAVWSTVFRHAGNRESQTACPPSAVGQPGTPLPYGALDSASPIPPDAIKVRVFNGSSQLGIGGTVAAELAQWGFTMVGQPSDDPQYPQDDLRCFGELRFGPAGVAAARTISLLAPCAELVQDDRPDDSVDVALGTDFASLAPNDSALNVLSQLIQWSHAHPGPTGGLQQNGDLGISISPALLSAARSTTC